MHCRGARGGGAGRRVNDLAPAGLSLSMPLIELTLPEGRLHDDEIEQLTTDLTAAASAAEGSNPEKATPLTWTLLDTYAPEEWRVGGQPANGPMYVIRANVDAELVDAELVDAD